MNGVSVVDGDKLELCKCQRRRGRCGYSFFDNQPFRPDQLVPMVSTGLITKHPERCVMSRMCTLYMYIHIRTLRGEIRHSLSHTWQPPVFVISCIYET